MYNQNKANKKKEGRVSIDFVKMSSEAGNYRLELFLRYQEKLESLLEEADLLKLSFELLEDRVIYKDAQDRFASLDQDHLRPVRRVRYLLQQVCQGIKDVEKVYDRLVKVLSRLGGGVKDVCEAMTNELEGVEGGKPRDGTRAVKLVEKDVPGLTKILISGSHMWDAIGIALNLPEHKRDECGEGKKNANRLNNILTSWVGGYDGASPATLDSLRTALASEIVGLGRLAGALHTFERPMQCVHEGNEVYADSKPEIIHQSYNTEVAEGKSTLLEVQASSNGCESYQWIKDGLSLLDGADFSGVSSNILYINRTSLGTGGKYSCCVNNGSETAYSDEVNVIVIYPPEKRVLMKFYSDMAKELSGYSWPPEYIDTFIKLVLIKQGSISKREYFTICGDMDDILESKEVIEYDEVFRDYREGALVLVEGRSGSGKTTLVRKVSKDWATKGKILQGANMVFLISLRLLNFSRRDNTFLDVLKIFYSGEYLTKRVERKLKECEGKGACFIIDGLDEYQPKSVEESVIYQLINKKCLPLSMVIVASRPVATFKLRECSTFRIEVLGFTKQQIYEYVERYPFSVSDLSSRLKLYLHRNLNILHMCYLPVHVAMICFLFSQLEGDIPHTETQIYEQFTISTILRQKIRNEEQFQLRSLKSLHGEIKEKFDRICKLAFEMTVKSQQVFSKSNAPVSLIDDVAGLGLLTVDRISNYYGIDDMYSFLHLTFQEYLAAFYIAGLEVQMQVRYIEIFARNRGDVFKNAWKFYCGLVDFTKHSILLSSMFSCIENKYDFKKSPFFLIQCAFESQQVTACDYVTRQGVLSIKNAIFRFSDFVYIGYIISTTSCLVTKLKFYDCTWNKDCISIFSTVDRTKLQHIKSLNIYHRSCKEDDFEAFNILLGMLPSLTDLEFNFRDTELNKSAVECLTRSVTLSQLKVLDITVRFASYFLPVPILKLLTFHSHVLQKVYIDDLYERYHYQTLCSYARLRRRLCYAFESQEILRIRNEISWLHVCNCDSFSFVNLESFSCCTEILLVNCGIDDEAMAVLSEKLNISVLEHLVVDFNRLSDPGAVALAGCLARCKVLREVSLQCNSIGDAGALALAAVLAKCRSLRRLDLQGNLLGDEGAIAIAKAAKKLPKMYLYLCNVNVTTEGIGIVLEHKTSARVKEMVFGQSWEAVKRASIDAQRMALNCGILPTLEVSKIATAMTLVNELDYVRKIRRLRYSLTDDTVPTMCKIMKSMWNLQELRVDVKNSEDSNVFIDSLKHCKSLRSLYVKFSVWLTFNLKVDGLSNFKNLQSLELICCNICSDDMAVLFHDHSAWINLELLNLEGNKIGSSGIEVLSKVLMHCNVLHCLNLSSTGMDDNGAVALAAGLKDTTSLQELRLRFNEISAVGLAALIPINSKHLRHLDLSEVLTIQNFVLHCDFARLQTLEFSCNDSGSDVAASLIVELQHCSQLEKLNISNNKFRPHDLSSIAEGIKYCKQLVTLDISDNNIGLHGMSSLAEGIKNCRQLVTLNISSNNIGLYGMSYLEMMKHVIFDSIMGSAIAEGIKHCTQLAEFDISHNNINSYDMSALAKGLLYCTNLKVLNLSHNEITSYGVAAIVGLMEACSDLQYIDLSFNKDINLDDAKALVSGWHHKSMLQLDLKSCISIHKFVRVDRGRGCERCCKKCDYLLKLCYDNDYVVVFDIPKQLVHLKWRYR